MVAIKSGIVFVWTSSIIIIFIVSLVRKKPHGFKSGKYGGYFRLPRPEQIWDIPDG